MPKDSKFWESDIQALMKNGISRMEAEDMLSFVDATATKYGILPGLLNAILREENNWKFTGGGKYAGIAQLKDSTAADLGLKVSKNFDERLNPRLAIDAAARYLKMIHDGDFDKDEYVNTMGGDWGADIFAYNVGPGDFGRDEYTLSERGKGYYRRIRDALLADAPPPQPNSNMFSQANVSGEWIKNLHEGTDPAMFLLAKKLEAATSPPTKEWKKVPIEHFDPKTGKTFTKKGEYYKEPESKLFDDVLPDSPTFQGMSMTDKLTNFLGVMSQGNTAEQTVDILRDMYTESDKYFTTYNEMQQQYRGKPKLYPANAHDRYLWAHGVGPESGKWTAPPSEEPVTIGDKFRAKFQDLLTPVQKPFVQSATELNMFWLRLLNEVVDDPYMDELLVKLKATYDVSEPKTGVEAVSATMMNMGLGLLEFYGVGGLLKGLGTGKGTKLIGDLLRRVSPKLFKNVDHRLFNTILFTGVNAYHAYALTGELPTPKEAAGSAGIGYLFPGGNRFFKSYGGMAFFSNFFAKFGLGAGLGVVENVYLNDGFPKTKEQWRILTEHGATTGFFAALSVWKQRTGVDQAYWKKVILNKGHKRTFTPERIKSEFKTQAEFTKYVLDYNTKNPDDFYVIVKENNLVYGIQYDGKTKLMPSDVVMLNSDRYKFMDELALKYRIHISESAYFKEQVDRVQKRLISSRQFIDAVAEDIDAIDARNILRDEAKWTEEQINEFVEKSRIGDKFKLKGFEEIDVEMQDRLVAEWEIKNQAALVRIGKLLGRDSGITVEDMMLRSNSIMFDVKGNLHNFLPSYSLIDVKGKLVWDIDKGSQEITRRMSEIYAKGGKKFLKRALLDVDVKELRELAGRFDVEIDSKDSKNVIASRIVDNFVGKSENVKSKMKARQIRHEDVDTGDAAIFEQGTTEYKIIEYMEGNRGAFKVIKDIDQFLDENKLLNEKAVNAVQRRLAQLQKDGIDIADDAKWGKRIPGVDDIIHHAVSQLRLTKESVRITDEVQKTEKKVVKRKAKAPLPHRATKGVPTEPYLLRNVSKEFVKELSRLLDEAIEGGKDVISSKGLLHFIKEAQGDKPTLSVGDLIKHLELNEAKKVTGPKSDMDLVRKLAKQALESVTIDNGVVSSEQSVEGLVPAAGVKEISVEGVAEKGIKPAEQFVGSIKDVINQSAGKDNPVLRFSNDVAMITGFSREGQGTSGGDAKDKAMREVADGFIGEIVRENSSSATSRNEIEAKGVVKPSVIMLARNKEFEGKALWSTTEQQILGAHKSGVTFIVGDMPKVDSQFIEYLDSIGGKYVVFAGKIPRVDFTGNRIDPSVGVELISKFGEKKKIVKEVKVEQKGKVVDSEEKLWEDVDTSAEIDLKRFADKFGKDVEEFAFVEKEYKKVEYKLSTLWERAKALKIPFYKFVGGVLLSYGKQFTAYIKRYFDTEHRRLYGTVKYVNKSNIYSAIKKKGDVKHRLFARAVIGANRIEIDEAYIKEVYLDRSGKRPWENPADEGVIKLDPATFKTLEEWRSFIIGHELIHFDPTIQKIKSQVLKENIVNYLSLRLHKFNVPIELEAIANTFFTKDIKPKQAIGMIRRIIDPEISLQHNKATNARISASIHDIAVRYGVPMDILRKMGNVDFETFRGQLEAFSKIANPEYEITGKDYRQAYTTVKNSLLHSEVSIENGKVVIGKKYRGKMPFDDVITKKYEMGLWKPPKGKMGEDAMSYQDMKILLSNGWAVFSPSGDSKQYVLVKIPKDMIGLSEQQILNRINKEPVLSFLKDATSGEQLQGLIRLEIARDLFGRDLAEDVLLTGSLLEVMKRVKIAFSPGKQLLLELLPKDLQTFRMAIVNTAKGQQISEDVTDGITYILPETITSIMESHGLSPVGWNIRNIKPVFYYSKEGKVLFIKTSGQTPPPEIGKYMRDNNINVLTFDSAAKIRKGFDTTDIGYEGKGLERKVFTKGSEKANVFEIPANSMTLLFSETAHLHPDVTFSPQIANYILRGINGATDKIVSEMMQGVEDVYLREAVDRYNGFREKYPDVESIRRWFVDRFAPEIEQARKKMSDAEPEMGELPESDYPYQDFYKFLANGGNPLRSISFRDLALNTIRDEVLANIIHPKAEGNRCVVTPDPFGELYGKKSIMLPYSMIGSVNKGDYVLVIKPPTSEVAGVMVLKVEGFLGENRGNQAMLDSKLFVGKLGHDYDFDEVHIITNPPKGLVEYVRKFVVEEQSKVIKEDWSLFGGLEKASFYDTKAMLKAHEIIRRLRPNIGGVAAFQRTMSILWNGEFEVQLPVFKAGKIVEYKKYSMKDMSPEKFKQFQMKMGEKLHRNVDMMKIGGAEFDRLIEISKLFGVIDKEHQTILRNIIDNFSRFISIQGRDFSVSDDGIKYPLDEYLKRSAGYNDWVEALEFISKNKGDISLDPILLSGVYQAGIYGRGKLTDGQTREYNTLKKYIARRHFDLGKTKAEQKTYVRFKHGISMLERIVKTINRHANDNFIEIPNTRMWKLWTNVKSHFPGDVIPKSSLYDRLSEFTANKELGINDEWIYRTVVNSMRRMASEYVKSTIPVDYKSKQVEVAVRRAQGFKALWRLFKWPGASGLKESDRVFHTKMFNAADFKDVNGVRINLEHELSLSSSEFMERWRNYVNNYRGKYATDKGTSIYQTVFDLELMTPDLVPQVARVKGAKILSYDYSNAPKLAEALVSSHLQRVFEKIYNNAYDKMLSSSAVTPWKELFGKEVEIDIFEADFGEYMKRYGELLAGEEFPFRRKSEEEVSQYGTALRKQCVAIDKIARKEKEIGDNLEHLCEIYTGKGLSELNRESAVKFLKHLRDVQSLGRSFVVKNFGVLGKLTLPEIISLAAKTGSMTPDGWKTHYQQMFETASYYKNFENSLLALLRKQMVEGVYYRIPESVNLLKAHQDEIMNRLASLKFSLENTVKRAIKNGYADKEGNIIPMFNEGVVAIKRQVEGLEAILTMVNRMVDRASKLSKMDPELHRMAGTSALLKDTKGKWEKYITRMEKIARALDGEVVVLDKLEGEVFENLRYLTEYERDLGIEHNEWVDKVYTPYAKAHGLRNLRKARFLEENYFPHMFESEKAYVKAIDNYVKEERTRMQNEGIDELTINLKLNMVKTDLTNRAKLDQTDDFMGKFFPHFLSRVANIKGYSYDVDNVFETYIQGFVRKIVGEKRELALLTSLNAMKKDVRVIDGVEYSEHPRVIKLAERYFKDEIGVPRESDIAHPNRAENVRKTCQGLMIIISHRFLGFRISSAITNLTQFKNAIALYGFRPVITALFKGFTSSDTLDAFDSSGVAARIVRTEIAQVPLTSRKRFAYLLRRALTGNREAFIESVKEMEKITRRASLWLFSEVEFNLRKNAFIVEYEKLRGEGIGNRQQWIKKASRFVEQTNFIYDNFGRPEIGKTPLGKLMTMYTTYTYNQLNFHKNLWKEMFAYLRTPGGSPFKSKSTRESMYSVARYLSIQVVLRAFQTYFSYSAWDRYGDEFLNFLEGIYKFFQADDDKKRWWALKEARFSFPIGLPLGVLFDFVAAMDTDDVVNYTKYMLEPGMVRDIRKTFSKGGDPLRFIGLWRTWKPYKKKEEAPEKLLWKKIG